MLLTRHKSEDQQKRKKTTTTNLCQALGRIREHVRQVLVVFFEDDDDPIIIIIIVLMGVVVVVGRRGRRHQKQNKQLEEETFEEKEGSFFVMKMNFCVLTTLSDTTVEYIGAFLQNKTESGHTACGTGTIKSTRTTRRQREHHHTLTRDGTIKKLLL